MFGRLRPSLGRIATLLALGSTIPLLAQPLPVLNASESRLLAPVLDPGANFGGAVAACGDLLVVGAPHDDLFASQGGAAYVYRWQNGSLVHLQTLLPPPADRLPDTEFGLDVDLVCGSTIDLIAVAYEPDGGGRIGGAFVFERDAAGIFQPALGLHPVLAIANDQCGVAVALDAAVLERNGDDVLVYRAVVGCPGTNRAGQYLGGAAYLFERQEGTGEWGGGAILVQSELLNPGDQRSDEDFGAAVDLHGNWVAIGTPSDFTAGYVGAVHLFGGGGTAPCSKIVPSTTTANSHFGWTVSIDPWFLAVGAFGEEEPGAIDTGAVYTWNLFGPIELCNTAALPLVTDFDERLTVPDFEDSDQLGLSVRVETPILVASLHGRDVPPDSFVGGAVAFRLEGTHDWEPVGRLEPQSGIGGSEAVGQGGIAFSAGVVYAGTPNDSVPPSSAVGSAFAWEVGAALALFADDFESGDTSRWSAAVP